MKTAKKGLWERATGALALCGVLALANIAQAQQKQPWGYGFAPAKRALSDSAKCVWISSSGLARGEPWIEIQARKVQVAPGAALRDRDNKGILLGQFKETGWALAQSDPMGQVLILWMLTEKEQSELSEKKRC